MINEDLDLSMQKGHGKETKANEDIGGKTSKSEKKEKDVQNVLNKGEFLADLDLYIKNNLLVNSNFKYNII